MDPALRASATGMQAQQTRVEVIANNLANVNTNGYKRSRAHFEDLLYQTVQGSVQVGQGEGQVLPAVQVGRGTRLNAVQRLHAQGPIEATGRALDLAIEGEGFFQVRMPDGRTAYTRDGSFTISDRGALVTHGGYALEPDITIPSDATEITVSRTGIVSYVPPGDTEPVELGRLELSRFMNPSGLIGIGENLYVETTAAGQPIEGFPQENGFGRLLQGSLEGSNVELVQEMVEMITAMRAYEISSKAIKASEDMAEITSNLVR